MPTHAPDSDPPFYGICPVKSLSFRTILMTPLREIKTSFLGGTIHHRKQEAILQNM